MTWTNYIFKHLIPAWFYSFKCNFYMWSDLMAGDYEGYAILPGDDPYTECYEWFWASLSMDETYPKEFLDQLQDLSKQCVYTQKTGREGALQALDRLCEENSEALKRLAQESD